jgi:ABC-2 type transport system ATP-binding protein
MAEPAIRIQDLTYDFVERGKKPKPVRAVDGLSLEVPSGSILGFLGPNGAGKTTTIRLWLGLLRPRAGRAEVLGYDVCAQADQVRAHTGALLEHTGLKYPDGHFLGATDAAAGRRGLDARPAL